MDKLGKSKAWQLYTILRAFYDESVLSKLLLVSSIALPVLAFRGGHWITAILMVVAEIAYNLYVYRNLLKYYNRVLKGWRTVKPRFRYTDEEMVAMLEESEYHKYEIETGYNLGDE